MIVDESITQLIPAVLDHTAYVVPFTKYSRHVKGVEGSTEITLTDNGFSEAEITIPGNNRLNLYETEIMYKLIVPASGAVATKLCLPTDCLTEIKALDVELTDGAQRLVSIPDLPKYTKQQCMPKLNFRTRGKKDRLYFNSVRDLKADSPDPDVSDPYYQPLVNNGINDVISHTHSNMIASTNLATEHIFCYKIRDILPNTYFELNDVKRYNSPIKFRFRFNNPNKIFIKKIDIANNGTYNTGGIPDGTTIRGLSIAYYMLNSDDRDFEEVKRKIDEEVYSFYYPMPLFKNPTVKGNLNTSLVYAVTSDMGISLYKMYVSLCKSFSNAANKSFLEANTANFNHVLKKFNRAVYTEGSRIIQEIKIDDRSYHQYIKTLLGNEHSFTSDRSYENYGSLIYVYDTDYNPNHEYDQITLKGMRLTSGTYENGYVVDIIRNDETNGDTDNTDNQYIAFITSVVFKLGYYDRGNIRL